MALVRCHECGHAVSTEAKACPSCGAKPRARSRTPVVVALILAFAFLGIFFEKNNSNPNPVKAAAPTTMIPAGDLPPPAIVPPPYTPPAHSVPVVEPWRWTYSESTDEMSGKKMLTASNASLNTHQLGFPYGGGTSANIVIRDHPRYGRDVIFQASNGQLLCDLNDGCSVLVRFDEKPAIQVNATEPADHSSDTLFLRGFNKLVSGMKQSKKMTVEATFYQEGDRSFEFDVAGLKWDGQRRIRND